jgi:hypothetical protein
MDRRNFLKGTLVGVTAATSTALVQLASQEDMAVLEQLGGENPRMTIGRPDNIWAWESPEVYMRDPTDGRMVCVGQLVDIKTERRTIDITQSYDQYPVRIQGPQRVVGTFVR